MTTVMEPIGTARIGSGDYQLVRADNKPAWSIDMIDEPPWEGGLQPLLSLPDEDWSAGGLHTHYTPGFTEFGQDTDCRWARRIVPGPKQTTITLGGSIQSPNSFFETLGHLFICCGPAVYKINPGTDVVTLSKDVTPETTIMGVGWEGNKGYVTVSNDSQGIWRVSAIGSPDTWNQASGVPARLLAVGPDRMFKIRNGGELRNVLSGLDPMNSAVWADRVQVGIDSGSIENIVPRGMVSYGRSVIVGKRDGFFGVDDEGRAFNLLKRIIPDNETGVGLSVIEPHVYIPHGRGTYRFQPGFAEAIGLEVELDNASIAKGRFTAFVSDGEFIYGILSFADTGGTSARRLMVGREKPGGYGPIVWDTLLDLTPASNNSGLHISSLWNPPRLFFAQGVNVGYIELPSYGGGPDIDESNYLFKIGNGTRFLGKYNFGTWLDKDFPKVQIACKNVTASNKWTLGYSIDGSAFSTLDINGNAMDVTSEGVKTFFLPRSARGREIQYRLMFTTADDDVRIEVVYFEPFAVPVSRSVPVIDVVLRLSEDLHHDFSAEGRSTVEQLNDLIALAEDSTPVEMKGPWGEWFGHVRKVQVQEVIQEGIQEPEYLLAVRLQRREEAADYV